MNKNYVIAAMALAGVVASSASLNPSLTSALVSTAVQLMNEISPQNHPEVREDRVYQLIDTDGQSSKRLGGIGLQVPDSLRRESLSGDIIPVFKPDVTSRDLL